MSAIRHATANFTRGDTWVIGGNLLDPAGLPLDLTGVTAIEWALFDLNGKVDFNATLGDGVEIVDAPTGVIRITITPVKSVTVPAGYYQDQLRITQNGDIKTMWIGQIGVEYSAFETP